MGVLYEHWRPDLNECFYVGISWANEDVRPYDMNSRNRHHFNIVKHLQKNGLLVEVKIQAQNLTQQELMILETLQISYWKSLIGNRLTNVSSGGDGVKVWTDDMRKRQSAHMKRIMNTPERKMQSIIRMTGENNLNKSPERRRAMSLRLKGVPRTQKTKDKIGKSCGLYLAWFTQNQRYQKYWGA